jgi:HlyD family secretion protein
MKRFFSRFSRRTWIIVGGVILAVVLVLIFTGGNRSEQSLFQTVEVGRGSLVATVGATGTVRSRNSATMLWQTSGTVETVSAKVGDRVQRGEVLASLDRTTLNQTVLLAEADLASAEKVLEDLLNSNTASAQAARNLDAAEEAYKKAYDYRKSLNGRITITEAYLDHGVPKVRYFKGYASKEMIADADEKLALAEAQLADARRAYDRLKDGSDPAEVTAAEARLAAAQATVNMAHIITPIEGTVTQATAFEGDQVSTGETAFRVDDLSHLLVDLQVSEVDINNIYVGQAAGLTFDAILDADYHGEVVEVGRAGDAVQGIVNFTVTVELTDADELVKPGMTAAVNITVEEVKDVILIPNRAVRLVDGQRVVYTLVEGMPVAVEVQLGSSSDTESALAGGDLKEGDLIILNPPSLNGGPFGG